MTSGEILDERRHNHLVYESGDMIEYPLDAVPLNDIGGTLTERYAEGRGLLHAHFRVATERNDNFRDYCAVIKRFREELDSPDVTPVRAEDGELGRCGCRQMRQPVLVAVGEHAKNPEGAGRSKLIPSVVWLQSLDDCPGVGMDAPDHAFTLVVEFGLGLEDRERGFPFDVARQRFPGVGDGEFVSEVVEGASEVVEAVPDDGGEHDGRGREDFGPDQLAAALDIRLGPNSTRIALTPDSLLRLYGLQVFGGPV
jgi:hypothetical protein